MKGRTRLYRRLTTITRNHYLYVSADSDHVLQHYVTEIQLFGGGTGIDLNQYEVDQEL